MQRMTDFPGQKFAKRFALNKGMKAKPSRKRDQNEQGENENQKTNAFHADEISLRDGIDLRGWQTISETIRLSGTDRKRSCHPSEERAFKIDFCAGRYDSG